jgi:hypothetical protein
MSGPEERKMYIAMVSSLLTILQAISLPANSWITVLKQVLGRKRRGDGYGSSVWKIAGSTLLQQQDLLTTDPWPDVGAWLLSEKGRYKDWGANKLIPIIDQQLYKNHDGWLGLLDDLRAVPSATSDGVALEATSTPEYSIDSHVRDAAPTSVSLSRTGHEHTPDPSTFIEGQQSLAADLLDPDLTGEFLYEDPNHATSRQRSTSISSGRDSPRTASPMELDERNSHQERCTSVNASFSEGALESESDELMYVDL